MMPQAKLQPRAPISIVRIFSRPASAMLSEPVKVRTMIRPKRTSETRSWVSSTRFEDLILSSAIDVTGTVSGFCYRQEIEQDRNHGVNDHELNAFIPMGPAVANHDRPEQNHQEERANFGAAEGKFQWLGRDETTDQHQDGRDKQGDLNAAAHGDPDGKIQLVFS